MRFFVLLSEYLNVYCESIRRYWEQALHAGVNES